MAPISSDSSYSALIPAALITGPHLSISDFRNAASSAGVELFGSAPSAFSLLATASDLIASTVAALILATISGGTLDGTKKANHDSTSKPGTVSPIGGRSGTTATRCLVVTAIPRTSPAWICGKIDGALSQVTSMRPGIRSL